MTIDKEKAKQSLVTLEREKQEIRDRLQLAAQAKRKFDAHNACSTRSSLRS